MFFHFILFYFIFQVFSSLFFFFFSYFVFKYFFKIFFSIFLLQIFNFFFKNFFKMLFFFFFPQICYMHFQNCSLKKCNSRNTFSNLVPQKNPSFKKHFNNCFLKRYVFSKLLPQKNTCPKFLSQIIKSKFSKLLS